MPKVDILLKGYNEEINPEFQKYASTTTLVRADGYNIVVDPGTHKSSDEYIDALKQLGLTIDDINYVFTTHEHIDHTRDIALFKNAEIIDIWGFHKGDEHRFFEDDEYEITPGITRVATPGHGINHSSLLVETNQGIICVAGDLWWYENFTPKKDPYATSQKDLEKSREMIKKIADYIVPGHGGMVKNIEKTSQ